MCNEIVILVDGVEKINISQISSYSKATEFTVLNGKFQGSYTYAEIFEMFGQVDTCGNRIVSFYNLSGDRITTFPMGVFDINGDLLGIANNQTELINIWNMAPTNASEGPATAAPNQTQVKLPKTSTIDGILTMRFWQVDLAANKKIRILYDTNDVILFPDGSIVTGVSAAPISASVLTGTFPGSINFPTGQKRSLFGANYYDYTTPISGTLYVFHNDTAATSGWLDVGYITGNLGGATNFKGYLPEKTRQITVVPSNGISNNFSQITNWLKLKEVECLGLHFWNSGIPTLATIPLFHHMKKLKFFITYYGNIPISTWGLFDKTIFPDLEFILYTYGTTGIYPHGSLLNASNKLKAIIVYSIYIAASASVNDNLLIELDTISNNVPSSDTFGIINMSGTRTSASDTARTNLISKGYFINL